MKRLPTTLVGLLALLASAAQANTVFTVDSFYDEVDVSSADGQCLTASGTCTLRAAVMQANTVVSGNTVIALPAGVYTFTLAPTGFDGADSGDLNFTTSLNGDHGISISGAGAATTIINGNGLDRVISIQPDRLVDISGVVIRGGVKPDSAGGGILNQGALNLHYSIVRENQALAGGGIASTYHSSALEGVTVLDHSTVEANVAGQGGGGIYNSGDLSVWDSTIRDNEVANDVGDSRNGGGIFNLASNEVRIDRSTLSGNIADQGGAVYNVGGSIIVRSSTMSGNAADLSGGAIFNASVPGDPVGTINIYNTSIIGNEADHDQDLNGGGGGLFNYAGSTLNIRNTLLADNYRSGAPVYDDCDGTIGVYGNNLFFNLEPYANCTFTGPGEVGEINSFALIGPLQNNGGPTLTHALLPGSNAIDGADPVGGCVDESLNLLPTDQRGFPRVVGGRCDVGAFEYDDDRIFSNNFDF